MSGRPWGRRKHHSNKGTEMDIKQLASTSRLAGAAVLLAAGIAASPAAQAQNANAFGCACLHNNTRQDINYRYHWGDNQWKNVALKANYQQWLCWTYAQGSRSSPPLTFQIDRDLSPQNAWTTYAIERVQSPRQSCDAFGPKGHYDIGYVPNTNNAFIQITRR